MVGNDEGIVSVFSDLQFKKHDSPNEFKFTGSDEKASEVQSEKTDLPKVTNEAGKLTETNPEHAENTPSSRPVIPSGNCTVTSLLQF